MAKKKAKKKVKKVRVVDIVKPEQPKGEIMERAAKVVTAIRRASTIDELKGLRVEASDIMMEGNDDVFHTVQSEYIAAKNKLNRKSLGQRMKK